MIPPETDLRTIAPLSRILACDNLETLMLPPHMGLKLNKVSDRMQHGQRSRPMRHLGCLCLVDCISLLNDRDISGRTPRVVHLSDVTVPRQALSSCHERTIARAKARAL
jgi:hypothetical protein